MTENPTVKSTLTLAIQRVEEKQAETRERFELACLECWLEPEEYNAIANASPEAVAEKWSDVYSAKCDEVYGLSSEFYEDYDTQEGVDAGFDVAILVLRELRDGPGGAMSRAERFAATGDTEVLMEGLS